MTRFRSILVATDFSVNATNAARRAVQLAKQHAARLRIIHVVDSAGFASLRGRFSHSADRDLTMKLARESLWRFKSELASPEVKAELELRSGDIVEELLRASQEADLIVVGQRGARTLTDVVRGSTVDRLLRMSRCPVLVVKQATEDSYRRVLVPIDFAPWSEAAIVAAASLAPDGDIQLFHAFDSRREEVLRQAHVSEQVIRESLAWEASALGTRMRRSVAKLGLNDRAMSFALALGPAVKATLGQEEAHRADLVVAGQHGRSRIGGLLLGSVSSRLLAQSRCDMLIVPGPVLEPAPKQRLGPAGRTAYIDSARLPQSTQAHSA